MSKKPIIAAFDFDGTLTCCDSLLPFLIYCFGPWKTALGLVQVLPTLLAYLVSLSSRQQTKEKILQRFFKGLSSQELRQMGSNYADTSLQRLLKPDILQKLKCHQSQGHRCILISASIQIYLEPWAASAGFDDILTSRLAFDKNGFATGKLVGLNCWGPEKSRRLLELLGAREGFVLYAYGDSAGDHELLEMADFPSRV